jgi:16S rRNA (adenine1518-N6/adenine1519-N6)-dimethyltransferase
MTSAIRKKKSLGQHFLSDPRILRKIATAGELSANDVVLEIGPGTGTLTTVLAERAKKVVAVEKDLALSALLKEKFSGQKNVEVICGDILTFNPHSLPYLAAPLSYKIVANIPYFLTGRILRLMFTAWPRPALAVLMLQKEVAERIVAKPPKMNRLAALCQYVSSPAIVAIVRRGAFSPPPKVDSAIIALKAIRPPRQDDATVAQVIAAGFSQPRKLLATNLARHFGREAASSALAALSLAPSTRPAELSPVHWERLALNLLPHTA